MFVTFAQKWLSLRLHYLSCGLAWNFPDLKLRQSLQHVYACLFVGHRNCGVLSFDSWAIGLMAALLSLHRFITKCGLMGSRSKDKQPVKILVTGAAGNCQFAPMSLPLSFFLSSTKLKALFPGLWILVGPRKSWLFYLR